jgi:DNA ligase-1
MISYSTPLELFTKTVNGGIYSWKIETIGNTIKTEYGLVDGKKTSFSKTIAGKNIGKSNETTPERQAFLESNSIIQKKLDQGYTTDPSDLQNDFCEYYKPMLAMDFTKAQKYFMDHDESYFIVQPKLDGIRCVAVKNDDAVVLFTRNGKVINGMEHITDVLNDMMNNGEIFDGELYEHGSSFSEIYSNIKSPSEVDRQRIQYHIFDAPRIDPLDESYCWARRFLCVSNRYHQMIGQNQVSLVEYRGLRSENNTDSTKINLEKVHQYFVDLGYEGCIIRNQYGVYEKGKRSNTILKYKAFNDAEFLVVDVEPFEGNPDLGVFVCRVSPDSIDTFRVVLKSSETVKKYVLENKELVIGRKLKVKFFGYTDYGIPRFPVGLGLRLEEDCSV